MCMCVLQPRSGQLAACVMLRGCRSLYPQNQCADRVCACVRVPVNVLRSSMLALPHCMALPHGVVPVCLC